MNSPKTILPTAELELLSKPGTFLYALWQVLLESGGCSFCLYRKQGKTTEAATPVGNVDDDDTGTKITADRNLG